MIQQVSDSPDSGPMRMDDVDVARARAEAKSRLFGATRRTHINRYVLGERIATQRADFAEGPPLSSLLAVKVGVSFCRTSLSKLRLLSTC